MINMIPLIPVNSVLHKEVTLTNILYIFLLSAGHGDKKSGSLVCEYSFSEVVDSFSRRYAEKDVENALLDLKSKELINISREVITIGNWDGSKRSIFTGNADSWEAEYEKVTDYANEFVNSLNHSPKKTAAIMISNSISRIFSISPLKWTTREAVELYRLTYIAYFQDFYRDMSDKEYGQMKNLFKLFDVVTLIKMIVHYIDKNELYGRSTPSIGYLLVNKDVIYKNCTGNTKAPRALAHSKNEENF